MPEGALTRATKWWRASTPSTGSTTATPSRRVTSS
jgi:hypothetical protein